MNTLIANQYGRVQGEVGGNGLVLSVAAETPRRESVHLQMSVDSVEQQLYLLAILRAVERRIEQFQLRDSNAAESQAREPESPFEGTLCGEGELLTALPYALGENTEHHPFRLITPSTRAHVPVSAPPLSGEKYLQSAHVLPSWG